MSIYLPLDESAGSSSTRRLTLGSMIGEARDQLRRETALGRASVDDLLAPAEELLATDPWPGDGNACGIFCAPGCSIKAQLEVWVPSMAVVADRFVAAPLLAAVRSDDRFYVTAIDGNRVRLLRGERSGLVEIALPGLSEERVAASQPERCEDRLQFYRLVDRAVWQALGPETAPLIVAGVAEELDRYRRANHYTHLAGIVAVDDTERLGDNELHERLWPAALRALDRPRRELLTSVRTKASAITSLPEIIAAGKQGRVAGLLVQPHRLLWGRIGTNDVHADRHPGDVELVTTAICAALEHFAMVFAVRPGELPDNVPVAAVLHD